MSGIYRPGISVVLPNYNGRHLLEANLPSLAIALNKLECAHEIIVADDASTDDSVHFLETNYPEIIIRKATKNQGFSSNCNLGAKAARWELLCIVNTDVIFDEDYFYKAYGYFQNNTALFAVKGDIIHYSNDINNPVNIGHACQLYFKRGLLRYTHNIKPDPAKFGAGIGMQFLPLGTGFICDTAKYVELGGYAEIFSPFYWEDPDLALRALEKGWQLQYAPECRLYHKTSSTISATQTNLRRRLVSIRNKHIFTWRHLKGPTAWSIHVIFTLLSILTRWLVLDWKYYIALTWALWRQATFQRTC